jgi:hypothetical protein
MDKIKILKNKKTRIIGNKNILEIDNQNALIKGTSKKTISTIFRIPIIKNIKSDKTDMFDICI